VAGQALANILKKKLMRKGQAAGCLFCMKKEIAQDNVPLFHIALPSKNGRKGYPT